MMLFCFLFLAKPIYSQTVQFEINDKGTLLDSQYFPWDSNPNYNINNLFSDTAETDRFICIHSNRTSISDDFPFIVLVDMGKIINANTFTIYNSTVVDSRYTYQPKTFVLYGGIDRDNLEVLADVKEGKLVNANVVVSFSARSLRYYKLVVTNTYCTGEHTYISYKYAKFSLSFPVSASNPKPTPFPGSVDTYINKVFTGSAGIDQIQAGDNNVRQISGCRFTDIHDTERNYYIGVTRETVFFDNIFENTEFITSPQKAGIIWDHFNGKVTIYNCTFTRISGKGGEGYIFTCNANNIAQVTMERCDFLDCGQNGNLQLISIYHAQSSIKLLSCTFAFTTTTRTSGVLELRNNDCVIDNCHFVGCKEDTILLVGNQQPQGTFQFTNNVVSNNKGLFLKSNIINRKPIINNNVFEYTTMSDNKYFINLPNNLDSIELNNNTFSHITSNGVTEKSVGGICLFIESTNSEFTLRYNNCKFLDVTNNANSHPNCQGGAIQYGFSDNSNLNCTIEIIKCEFRGNKAKKHGGAVAIRTAKSVLIQDCIFESNIANNLNSDSQLLFDNYDDFKTDGFGGSIYLNPTFNLNGNDYQMSSVNITGCTFLNNQAYQGNAIYVEGDSSDTTYTITSNTFSGNLNDKHIICSEILTLDKATVISSNKFTNTGKDKEFLYVGHDGLNPKPTNFPGSADTYINKVFTDSVGTSQIQAEGNIKQFSGCRFTNIAVTDRNYYIQVKKETIFFDNIFENTEFITTPERAGIIWDNFAGKITLSNCTFNKISGRGGEGYIFTSNGLTSTQVLMDRCNFIDCGKHTQNLNDDLKLISLLCSTSSIKLLYCNFTFTTTRNCGVLHLQNNDCVFDNCEFVGCREETILLAKGAGANDQTSGTFQFTNNVVKNNQGKFINTVRLITKPIIDNNIFEYTTMSSEYFINLPNNQPLIELNNNTFSHITSNGATEKSVGGIGLFIESSNSEFTLRYNNCKFLDNTNNLNELPNSQGGAIQYGFSDSSNLNCYIEITRCEFKGNKAKIHGGAVAVRTTKSVLIQDCIFESNIANNVNSNSQLLSAKTTKSNTNGCGGSVFIAPVFTANNNNYQMSSLSITGCEFKENKAYQGYGIYIEGEECDTSIIVSGNKFEGNTNAPGDSIDGSVVCSEILSVSKRTILLSNEFVGSDPENTSPSFNYVDTNSEPIPDNEQPPDLVVFTIHNSTSDGRHDIEEDTKQTVLIQINISSFTGIGYSGDGGAIRIINAGIECNKTTFTSCHADNAGGAIYLSNSYDYLNSMCLNDLNFNNNRAQYGGALYIYSVSQLNLVSLKYCSFSENEATAPESTTAKYGGSAAFITARNSTILNNAFSNNRGTGPVFRIYNKFVKKTQSIYSVNRMNQGHIVISGCHFEIGKDSKSCLFYDHGNNDDPTVDLIDCEFTGNLAPGSHFIDGKSSIKDANTPKLSVKGCKFDSNYEDALNIDQNKKLIKVDPKDQIFNSKKSIKKMNFDNLKISLFVAIPAAFTLVVLLVLIVVKKRNQKQDDQQDTKEEADISNNEVLV